MAAAVERGRGRYWDEQMKERWAGMSEEEREKFRAGMGGAAGGPARVLWHRQREGFVMTM